MKISNQKGVAHVMVVVAVVAVAAVGGTGYLVLKNNDNKKSSQSSSTTSSAAIDTSLSKTSDETAVKAAAKKHFSLVYQKKISEAYNSATCKEFRDLTSYEKFQDYLKDPGFQTIDLSAVEYTSVDVRNSQAAIKGPVGPLDPNSTLKVSLLKKDGAWCIYGYSIE